MKSHTLKIIFTLYLSLGAFITGAQKIPGVNSLQQVIASVDSFNVKLPAEQLYIHFDKSNYSINDTVWFKAYILLRNTHAYSPLSGILYVELIADSNRLVRRLSFPAAYGLSWGQIVLDKDDIGEGNYFIRAYTNWMQNFGEDYFYHRAISVSAPLTATWMIKENHTMVSSADKNDIDFTLQLSDIDSRAVKQMDVDVKIVTGKKVLFRQDLRTTNDGILKGKFSLPFNTTAKDLNLVLQDKSDPSKRSIVPIVINRSQNIDLQFMPESGYMVEGILSKIGFKAIGENGMGIEVYGKIVDSKNTEVASFRSLYRGMGTFEFMPVKNEIYTAIVEFTGGNTIRFALPPVKKNGIVLQFQNEKNSDSVKLKIKVSPDLVDNKTYYLTGLSRGVVCYGAKMVFRNREINTLISKKLFPSGIAHFTLMDMSGNPVNERRLFIDHSDDLSIDIRSLKNFSARDSIPLHIKVNDKQGKPVTGSFSISVTDDAQVNTENINAENIVTRFMLTSDIKGNIEAPDYYIDHTDRAWQALDVLLLTQGWTGYDWTIIMKPPLPAFIAEPIFSVRGRVTNLFSAPINKARIVLMSPGSRLNVRDTVTGSNGEFVFTNFKKLDSLSFFIDARNARDKKFGITLTVDQFKPAQLKPWSSFTSLPWYVNSDSTIINYAQNKQRMEAALFQLNKYKRLQEVKINIKKVVKGSSNLNGAGQADQIIDEADLEKETGKGKTLWDLIKEKLKGFMDLGDGDIQQIKNYKILYIIDGISLRNFGPARETLESLDVEDVKGIEVMNSPKYLSRYQSQFMTLAEQINPTPLRFVFIEITTRSGSGIFFKKSPGLMVYKPVPITLPAQFYSPKYVVKNSSGAKDLRSTLYWNPALITDKNGNATTYFYAADTPTTYTVMIQGSDISGSVGYKVEKILVR